MIKCMIIEIMHGLMHGLYPAKIFIIVFLNLCKY